MMLSPQMIKGLVANLQLAILNGDHFDHLMNGLSDNLNEEQHLDDFDCFAFAWGLLPEWAKIMLMSTAYREAKTLFTGVRPLTSVKNLNEQQREVLSNACHKLLTATVTLMADWDFTEDFYKRWAPARREALRLKAEQTIPGFEGETT